MLHAHSDKQFLVHERAAVLLRYIWKSIYDMRAAVIISYNMIQNEFYKSYLNTRENTSVVRFILGKHEMYIMNVVDYRFAVYV